MVSDRAGDERGPYQEAEWRWAKRLCLLSPLAALIAIPILDHYLLTLMYLQPADSQWHVIEAFRSKPAIALALAMASLPFAWLAGLKLDPAARRSRIPWAVVLAAVVLIGVGAVLSVQRPRWFFVEWAKVRTPNPSFARNTLFWEQRNFAHTQSPLATAKVGLVGSSQTNQGFNLDVLQAESTDFDFEKNCLAGFGPMQYPFLQGRIGERGFQTIVCQLSEFDFYREDEVPLTRLRWSASLVGTAAIASTLTHKQRWENRGAIADLVFASAAPLWRLREHFRRTLFGYWWNKSLPAPGERPHANAPTRLANTPGLEQAIEFLKQNIGHKKLVQANFASFELFAKQQRENGVNLVVVEGQVHPQARAAYDNRLQQTTRKWLTEMAAEYEFSYFDSEHMPAFTANDFADAYHLNEQGQKKISSFLAEKLEKS